jgi:hypothetical protein
MAIIQAAFALISRSLGRILSALFGWAVVALFGHTDAREKIWLSALVGAAAAWPILVLGVIWPRVATFVLSFVPLPSSVPTWSVRLVWIVLAASVPFALGIALATRSRAAAAPLPGTPPGAPTSPLRESRLRRLLRGFPITVAIAAAFWIVFVTVPALRVVALIRRLVDVQVPLVTGNRAYDVVAAEVASTLDRHGFEIQAAEPGFWVTAPSRILLTLGGPSFREYVPEKPAHYRGPGLEVFLYPNGLLLRGSEQQTAWAHGVVVEALADAPAYQTFDPAAQDIERQIRSVWEVFRQNPAAHRGSARLEARLDEIARDIRRLPVPYDEWQIVYRQALQLDRALRGVPQLLDGAIRDDGAGRNGSRQEVATARSSAATHPNRGAGDHPDGNAWPQPAYHGARAGAAMGNRRLADGAPDGWRTRGHRGIAGRHQRAAVTHERVAAADESPLPNSDGTERGHAMGQRTLRPSATSANVTGQDGTSPREMARQIEGEIALLREELGDLVAELDRRRHQALDLKLHVRRHALEVFLTSASLVAAAGGLMWFGIWRSRQRESLVARTGRLRQAVSRMIDNPERVAAEPTVSARIARAAVTTAVAAVIKKIMERGVQALLDQRGDGSPSGRSPWERPTPRALPSPDRFRP